MTALKVLVLLPLWLSLSALSMQGPSSSPSASPSASPSQSPSAAPSPTPPPTPTPVNAFITLDVTAGGPTTTITVSGGSFNAGQSMSIYWDSPNKVIGNATADGHGNFSGVTVKPFAGDPPGLHHVCASVLPKPCATFEMQGPPSPTPTPPPSPSGSPSPSPSASPSASPTPTPIAIPVASNTNGLDVLLHPPFIFLPFLAALGLLGFIAYWFLASTRRTQPSLPAANIVHRSVRPGYGLAQMDIRQAPVGPTPDAGFEPPAAAPPGDEPPPPGPEEPPPITES